jgi:SAM-dependent methyltransferase
MKVLAAIRKWCNLPPFPYSGRRATDSAVTRMVSDWLGFWDSSHSIYVNARHKDVHYRLIAQQVAALVPAREARVLDYGSGEALHADLVAAVSGELLLCEAAPGVRASLEGRFAGDPKIRIVAPREVAQLPEHSLDLIVLHSVAQYLAATETDALFAVFQRLLKASGLLVVSDVIPPHVEAPTDAAALLRFGAANGFFIAAFRGLIRTLFSDYRRLRSGLGLTCYAETAMIEKLSAASFEAHRAPENIGHNQARMAFTARPAVSGSTS